MKKTGRFAFLYTSIKNKEDAVTILSAMSLFWYIAGIILTFVLLVISLSTKEEISLLFPITLISAGYLLSHRKSRVLASFILVYSIALNGMVIWSFSRLSIIDFTHGLNSVVGNSYLLATILYLLSHSLVILLLALCSWAACRSFMATFIYHKEIESKVFWRNIIFVYIFIFAFPYFVQLPYLFSEMSWQHIKYTDTYLYLKEKIFFPTALQFAAIISFAVMTKIFPLVRTGTNIHNRLESLYKPIVNEKDAERVLLDLSIFFYMFAALLIIISVGYIVYSQKKIADELIPVVHSVIFFLAGHSIPRRKSRLFSSLILIFSSYTSTLAIWFFLYLVPPTFHLHLIENVVEFIRLSLAFFIIFFTWVAIRTTIATFVYQKHSQLKTLSLSGKKTN